MATLLVCHCLLKLQIELKGMNVCLPTLENTLKCVKPKRHSRFSGERDLGKERVLLHQILVMWSTYVVFIQEAQYRWVLALGYPNDLSTGSRVLGAFMLIAKALENHLKWPKQFVFLGQYMFLHFFKDYFLQCDYLKNTNLTCIVLGVMWSGNCVWK